MDDKKLKKVLKAADKKNQVGIIIYANEDAFNDLSSDVKQGNTHYDKVLKNVIDKQKETVVYAKSFDQSTVVAFICIPVKKMLSSKEYFDQILKICNNRLIKGPVVFIPSNEVHR